MRTSTDADGLQEAGSCQTGGQPTQDVGRYCRQLVWQIHIANTARVSCRQKSPAQGALRRCPAPRVSPRASHTGR